MKSFLIFLVVILIYFLPSMIANDKKHFSGIVLLNLFLGWTLLGWLAALIWAASSPKQITNKTYLYTCNKCGLKKSFDSKLSMFKCPNCGCEEKF